jgi:hypothetical protein
LDTFNASASCVGQLEGFTQVLFNTCYPDPTDPAMGIMMLARLNTTHVLLESFNTTSCVFSAGQTDFPLSGCVASGANSSFVLYDNSAVPTTNPTTTGTFPPTTTGTAVPTTTATLAPTTTGTIAPTTTGTVAPTTTGNDTDSFVLLILIYYFRNCQWWNDDYSGSWNYSDSGARNYSDAGSWNDVDSGARNYSDSGSWNDIDSGADYGFYNNDGSDHDSCDHEPDYNGNCASDHNGNCASYYHCNCCSDNYR